MAYTLEGGFLTSHGSGVLHGHTPDSRVQGKFHSAGRQGGRLQACEASLVDGNTWTGYMEPGGYIGRVVM